MANMMGGFIPELQKNPGLQGILRMVSKFGRVAKELNFFQSSSSLSTMDGNKVVTRTVTNYREPPAPTAPPKAPTDDEKPDGKSGDDGR